MKRIFSVTAVFFIAGCALSATAAESTKSLTFDDVKLDMKNEEKYRPELLTDKVKALAGKTVSIKGFMSPSFKADDITEFVLMRNSSCKFGRDAPHHFVRIKLAEGESVKFQITPLTVEGRFKIEELKLGKKVFAIYRMTTAEVK
jgi:hypothetical protein